MGTGDLWRESVETREDTGGSCDARDVFQRNDLMKTSFKRDALMEREEDGLVRKYFEENERMCECFH